LLFQDGTSLLLGEFDRLAQAEIGSKTLLAPAPKPSSRHGWRVLALRPRDNTFPAASAIANQKEHYAMIGARKPPPFCPSNTAGMGTAGKVELSNGEQSWTEHFDLVSEAATALKSGGHAMTTHKTWIEHGDSGLLIQPQLAELRLLEGGGVHTVTTMQVNHPTLIPTGVFEYQHSTGTPS